MRRRMRRKNREVLEEGNKLGVLGMEGRRWIVGVHTWREEEEGARAKHGSARALFLGWDQLLLVHGESEVGPWTEGTLPAPA